MREGEGREREKRTERARWRLREGQRGQREEGHTKETEGQTDEEAEREERRYFRKQIMEQFPLAPLATLIRPPLALHRGERKDRKTMGNKRKRKIAIEADESP